MIQEENEHEERKRFNGTRRPISTFSTVWDNIIRNKAGLLSKEKIKNYNRFLLIKGPGFALRTEVRGGFNIHGTKYFEDAVLHQSYKPPVPLVGQTTCSLHEILTRLVITENAFRRQKVQEGLQHYIFFDLWWKTVL